MVYDGDCGFCRLWIGRWKELTGKAVDYEPYQTAASRHPSVPREAFAEAVHLFEPGGRVSRGAEAVLRSLSRAPGLSWLPAAYAIPGAAPVLEAGYRFVAARRPFFSRLTRLLWGASPAPAPVERTARLFLAALGLCYLAAFASLGVQVRGLIGAEGIMPAGALLTAASEGLGWQRYWAFPTLAWIASSDAALTGFCVLGGTAALGLISGLAAGPCALAAWALYLSLSAVGADFLSFQWDALLLEAGLIAVFLPAWRRGGGASRGALLLARLLLVKLMLQSAVVKLASGDPAWRELTALTWHYWTQPLPNPPAWFAHHAPLWFHKASCAAMFAIEFAAPLLLLGPRRVRALGAALIAALMLLIAATGNYGFFNLLTLALCVAALDDALLPGTPREGGPVSPARRRAVLALAALWLAVSASLTAARLGRAPSTPERAVLAAISPLRSFNAYGLFAVMTKSRDEISLEVSLDGLDWREWPFPYKPGDALRAPPWAGPHMPRLDWQMWFAALGPPAQSPWFGNFLYRVLQGSPAVKDLLGPDPLGGAKPRYARAVRWGTAFSSPEERRVSGTWWTRRRGGLFYPVVSLRN